MFVNFTLALGFHFTPCLCFLLDHVIWQRYQAQCLLHNGIRKFPLLIQKKPVRVKLLLKFSSDMPEFSITN